MLAKWLAGIALVGKGPHSHALHHHLLLLVAKKTAFPALLRPLA